MAARGRLCSARVPGLAIAMSSCATRSEPLTSDSISLNTEVRLGPYPTCKDSRLGGDGGDGSSNSDCEKMRSFASSAGEGLCEEASGTGILTESSQVCRGGSKSLSDLLFSLGTVYPVRLSS